MKATALCISVCIFLPTQVFSAALETSNQSIASFLEPNNYLEFSTAIVDANVSGNIYRPEAEDLSTLTEVATPNFVRRYVLFNTSLKLQLHPNWSLGFIYDQPFGTNVDYTFDPIPSSPANLINATQFKLDTKNLSSLLGYQPNPFLNFYAGLSHQTLSTQVKISGAIIGFIDRLSWRHSKKFCSWLARRNELSDSRICTQNILDVSR